MIQTAEFEELLKSKTSGPGKKNSWPKKVKSSFRTMDAAPVIELAMKAENSVLPSTGRGSCCNRSIYRSIENPQAFKPNTRMPNLGLSKDDALAIALYVSTLRAQAHPQ